MKKYILLLIYSIFISITINAKTPTAGGDEDFEPSEEATHIPAMIQVVDEDIDDAIADLTEKGVIVLRHRGNILLTFIPVGQEQNLRCTRGSRNIEISKPRKLEPTLNQARNFNNANYIAEGLFLPQPYDGKGVVVGVCDIGIDTRHPTFLSVDQTECRIRRAVHYQELQGLRTVYSTPEEIYEWETDNPDDWHATHVTGIAAGAHKASGYYSLAPGADIVFTGSQLSDVGLLAGVEDIIEYAKEVDKPAVINLSMGNYVGPHDGSSLFTQYLDLCANDAIICLSSGNEGRGNEPKSMSYDFTESKKELRVLPNDWGGTDYTGEAEIWSKDSTPFNLALYWNCNSGYDKRLDCYNFLETPEEGLTEWRISTDPEDPDYDEVFASHFKDSYLQIVMGISPLNGRYYANMEFELKSDELHGSQAWAEYWPGIWIKGEPGTHVDIYCAGGSFLRQERNFPAPDNNQNVSDLATGFRTISVGMMNNTAQKEDALPGSGYAKGDVHIASSYGTTIDGRVFPLTVAPGADIISSMSSAYLKKYPEDVIYMTDESEYDGSTVYWLATNGTSMSCPFVVSAIATWLQAYPQLTVEDAQAIIVKTNRTYGYPSPDDPRHGQGWFNAYNGLQEVVNLAATNVGIIDFPEVTVRVEGTLLLIGNPEGSGIMVDIFNPAGLHIDRREFHETLGSISLGSLPPGLYLINIITASGYKTTHKVII